jgi:hypothetical protein
VSYTANNYFIPNSLILSNKNDNYTNDRFIKDDELARNYIITLPILNDNAIKERDVNKSSTLINRLPRDVLEALNLVNDVFRLVYNTDVACVKLNQLFLDSLLDEFITSAPENNKAGDASKSTICLTPLTTS